MSQENHSYCIRTFGGPLDYLAGPVPEALAGQVIVKICAGSLNYRDILVRSGAYNPRFSLPLVPVSDGAGEVVSVGLGVRHIVSGDRVTLTYMEGWQGGPLTDAARRATLGGPVDGVLTRYRRVCASNLVKTPPKLSDAQAACLPCAGVTAWTALTEHCGVKAGEWVLVQGTGGVSLFALQFAKAMGARVAVISSSDAKLDLARRHGADFTVNYRETPEWSGAILKGPGPMQHVIEVGGAGTLQHSLRAVATAGNIALIGVLAGVEVPLSVTSILMRGIKLHGVAVGSRRNMQDMFRAIEAHQIRPVIDRSFGFHEMEAAYDRLAAGKHVGKIVIEGFDD